MIDLWQNKPFWSSLINYSIDTRTLKPGDIFIPVKGPNFDGHDFIPEAIKKGASKIIDEDLGNFAKKYRRKLDAIVIGITGSYGKTTVKDMLYAILSPHFSVVKNNQNENNEIGVPLTLLKADAKTEIILVEMGMRKPNDIRRLSQIVRPSIGVLTGIGLSHIEFFNSQRQLALHKAKLFLPPLKWEPSTRAAFICHHSDYYDIISEKAKDAGFKTFSYKGATHFEDNLALCYSLGHYLGLDDTQIQSGLSSYQASDHRLEKHTFHSITVIDDSYNANPNGMRYALHYLTQCSGRKIAILGDMKELGRFSQKAHQDLYDVLLDTGIDLLFTIGEHFKSCQFNDIDHTHCESFDELKQLALLELKGQDSVLIKGSRVHQLDQLLPIIKEAFL